MTTKRTQYDEYITSERWRRKRQQFFRSDPRNLACAGCGTTGPGLHVHHRTYLHLGNEPMEDLVTVCQSCHARIHADIDSWSPHLSRHTDNVLAKVRREGDRRRRPVKVTTCTARPGNSESLRKLRREQRREQREQEAHQLKAEVRDHNKLIFDKIREKQKRGRDQPGTPKTKMSRNERDRLAGEKRARAAEIERRRNEHYQNLHSGQ